MGRRRYRASLAGVSTPPARAAVYNRYWTTGGGAEAYGGAVAELLSRRGPVELLGHEAFDPAALGERLALDLSGCTVRTVPHTSAAVTAASGEVELFVNVSHRSRDAAAAPRSLYVVHFPTALGSPAPPPTTLPSLVWGTGLHTPDGRSTWTDGAGTLLVTTEPGRPVELTVLLGFARAPEAGPTDVRVLVDGREVAGTRLGAPRHRLEVFSGRPLRLRGASPAAGVPVEVVLTSGSFVPADLLGGDDRRTLGVPVTGVALGRGTAARLTRGGLSPATSMAWLDSYDRLVANSAFTAGWVEQLWRRPSTVLHPPVSLRRPGAKADVLLAVGRFFPTGRGHSKKQLEMVRAFRRLVDGGVTGWTLHLVGGCADDGRAYLDGVRAEAAGLPVVVHPNATGAELDALYAQAAVFWHLAGLDEDPVRDPDRLEHFGISTVEAMSAGAVPVVLRAGGLVETVRDGIDGHLVDGLDDLVARTAELVADPAGRAAMSAAAVQRAAEFSLAAFDARLQALLDPPL